MGDLTKNISRHELECNCGCGLDSMDYETIKIVQDACEWAESVLKVEKVTLRINSAARCENHNSNIGGSNNSQHTKCRAMDIVIVGIHPTILHSYFSGVFMDKYGLGEYDDFTHIDTRSGPPARWKG